MARSTLDVASALQTLSTYRARGTRASQDIVEKGVFVLENNGISKLGDEIWAFLEQLAIAALDIGDKELADDCITRLLEKFPGSPRVECLQGIRIEYTGNLEQALAYYDNLLEQNESNVAILKRRISVLRQLGKIDQATAELVKFLDIFYTDVEGWLELADIYSSSHLYPQSQQALSHAMLLAPQNPFYVQQAAETAYTSGDIPLAAKLFLQVVDMAEEGGLNTRGWFGVKLATQRLLHGEETASASETPVPKHVELLEQLATERLLAAYSGGSRDGKVQGREVVVKWLERR